MFYWGFFVFIAYLLQEGLSSLKPIFRHLSEKSYYKVTTVTTAPFSELSPFILRNLVCGYINLTYFR